MPLDKNAKSPPPGYVDILVAFLPVAIAPLSRRPIQSVKIDGISKRLGKWHAVGFSLVTWESPS